MGEGGNQPIDSFDARKTRSGPDDESPSQFSKKGSVETKAGGGHTRKVNAIVDYITRETGKTIAGAGQTLSEIGIEGDEIRPAVQKMTEQQILDDILQAPGPAETKIPVLRVNHPCVRGDRMQSGNETVKVDNIVSGENFLRLPSFGTSDIKTMTEIQRMTRKACFMELSKKLAFAPSEKNGNGEIRLGLLGSCKIIDQPFDTAEMGGPEDMHDPDHKNGQPVAKGMKVGNALAFS